MSLHGPLTAVSLDNASSGRAASLSRQTSKRVSLLDTVIVDRLPSLGVGAVMVKKIFPPSPGSHGQPISHQGTLE